MKVGNEKQSEKLKLPATDTGAVTTKIVEISSIPHWFSVRSHTGKVLQQSLGGLEFSSGSGRFC